MSDQEITGHWWNSAEPLKKYAGILKTMETGEVTLTLIGNDDFFDSSEFWDVSRLQSFDCPSVLGLSSGTPFTIVRTDNRSSNTYGSLRVIRGKQYSNADNVLISGLFVNFTSVEDWAEQNPFGSKRNPISYAVGTQNIEYEPDDILFKVVAGDGLTITCVSKVTEAHSVRKKILLEHQLLFTFDFNEPQNLSRVEQDLYEFQKFLTIVIGEPIYISGQVSAVVPETEEEPVPFGIVIDFQESSRISNQTRNFPHGLEYPLFAEIFPRVLAAWYETREALRLARANCASVFFFPTAPIESQFLNLVQALESFHRISIGGNKLMPDLEYHQLRKVLIDSIPESTSPTVRERVADHLNWGNEISQRVRLEKCLERISSASLSKLHIEPKDFVKKVISTRNFLIHGTVKGPRFESLNEFKFAVRQLTLVLRMMLLADVGIPVGVLEERLFRYW